MKTIKINLPKGKEAHDIVATPHGCYIEVTYNLKDSWTPKDGEFVSLIANDARYLLIYKQKIGFKIESYVTFNTSYKGLYMRSKGLYMCCILHNDISTILPATEEEKQTLLDTLHKNGKDWDAENKKIIPYRWRPNIGDTYYCITEYMNIFKGVWYDAGYDHELYNRNNFFHTKEEAEAMRDRIQKILNGEKLKGE